MDKSTILYLRLIEDYCSQRRKDAKCLKGTLLIGKAFLQAELPRIPLICTNEFLKTRCVQFYRKFTNLIIMNKSTILYLRLIEDYCSQRRKDAKCLKGTLFIGKAFLQAELPRIPLICTNEFLKTRCVQFYRKFTNLIINGQV